MATVYLAPSFGAGYQGFSAGGLPLNTGTITTYLAGGTTPKETYTTSAGSVQCANPIVLGLDGRPSTEIWLVSGFAYRFDLKDSLGNLIKTYDNLSGIGDPLIAASVFGASLIAGASATVDRGLLGLADATAKGDTLSAAAAGAFTRKAVGADGAVLVADTSQTDGLAWISQYPTSIAPNPFFMIDQRVNSATARADDTYASDRWYTLTQTASVNVTTQTDQESGQPFNVRLIQNQAAAQRLGYASIIEGKDCKYLRGKQVTFRPRVRISNSQAIRIAVLEWTGTEDSVTSDVVLTWTSATYTAGNFFLAANLTISGVGSKTPSAATWTDMDALTVTLGSSFTNLILFVWTEQTVAQNVTFDIGKVRFLPGSVAGEIAFEPFEKQLAYCQRYYWKTFNYTIAPATFNSQYDGAIKYAVCVAGATVAAVSVPFTQTMRTNPTMTFFNPGAANSNWRNVNDTADSGASSQFGVAGARGFTVTNQQVAGDGAGEQCAINATAEAEL